MTANKIMNGRRRLQIAGAWVAAQEHYWALDRVNKTCADNPREGWSLLQVLVELANSKRLIEDVAAGPLEEFIRANASSHIEKIEGLAKKDARFRKALRTVWIRGQEIDQDLTKRLVALGCQDVDNLQKNKHKAQHPLGTRRR